MSKITNIPKEDKKMLHKIFWRFFTMQCDMNYVKGGAQGWTYSLLPAIDRYYDKPEDQVAAMQRHMCFINITQEVAPFTVGLVTAMEKENSQRDDFDPASINAMKMSLMGPMAGVGDALFLNIIRIVAAGVTIPMAELGNPLAPILFLIICNIPNLICRYYGLFLGYTLGTSFLEKMYREGTMEAVLKAASIIGLTVIGCTVATSVNFSTSLAINFGENAYALQTVFDSIFQGILPLSITLGCFYLARVKKVGINMLLVGIILFSILCAVLHIA